MPTHRFHQLDVFTRTPLAGNPLAVFPDAEDIDPGRMQAIAREMNLSETVFVTRSDVADARLRIFTPTAEIPLAGHPVIGTWWLLAELGRVPHNGDGPVTVRQETGKGILPVDIVFAGGAPSRVVMTQARPEFGAPVTDREALAYAIGADEAALGAEPAPEVVSTALPQMMVPIQTVDALAALPSGGSGASLVTFLRAHGTDCVMLYALDRGADPPTARCRMFAPGLGVTEDPATGSAAGALGAHLVARGVVAPREGAASLVIDQGVEIGRPSRIYVDVAAGADGAVEAIRVGGEAVRVVAGEVTF